MRELRHAALLLALQLGVAAAHAQAASAASAPAERRNWFEDPFIAATHGLPVIARVAAAVTLAQSRVRLGLKTSRLGPYAAPRSKTYSGPFAPFQP